MANRRTFICDERGVITINENNENGNQDNEKQRPGWLRIATALGLGIAAAVGGPLVATAGLTAVGLTLPSVGATGSLAAAAQVMYSFFYQSGQPYGSYNPRPAPERNQNAEPKEKDDSANKATHSSSPSKSEKIRNEESTRNPESRSSRTQECELQVLGATYILLAFLYLLYEDRQGLALLQNSGVIATAQNRESENVGNMQMNHEVYFHDFGLD